MKVKYIFLISILLFTICSLLYFESIKNILRSHLPFHTMEHVQQIIQDRQINYTKKDYAYSAMEDFFLPQRNPTFFKANKKDYFYHKGIDIEIFTTNFLTKIKNSKAKGGAYLAASDKNLIIAQENGLFFYLSLKDLNPNKDQLSLNNIPSNIFSLVKYFDFYGQGQYGVKGLYADEKHIYVSVSFMKKLNCFNTSILRAAHSESFLIFDIFFTPNACVEIDNDYGEYNASDSGGRIASYTKNNILYSTGTFRYRDLAQDPKNELGKILSIDKNTAKAKIISMGHRNVMGLTYFEKTNEIWSTEHGPNGGDEINLNDNLDSVTPTNFGWPVSSYGEHYSASSLSPEGALIVDSDDKTYNKAPLHKSHSDFGFREPELYFVPSIGISAITTIKKNFFKNFDHSIVFGSKGNNYDAEGEKTIFLYDPNEQSKEKIFSGERIRDILYLDSHSLIIFTGETNGIVGMISSN